MNYTRRKMNSFKKIALGLVAAMTLGTIVATPASANTVSVAVTTKAVATDDGSAALPLTINVPFDNAISDTAVVTSEVLTLTATVPSGTPVTFATTGANTKLLTAIGSTVTTASGVTSLTVTPAATTAVAYLYTTSTSASAVTVSVLGASTTLYVKGIAGPAFNVTLSVPATGNIGGSVTATALVTDIFGNPKATAPVFTAINATAAAAVQDTLVTNKYTSIVTLPTTGGSSAVGVSITAPTAVPTLATAVTSASAIVSTVDLAAALAAEKAARAADKVTADAALAAALAKSAADAAAAKAAADAAALTAAADLVKANAEIAKLKADAVTAKVAADKALADASAAHAAELAKVKADNDAAIAAMKKAFNALAAKWNKANPKAKVALVK
jgi:subtilase-type serine protease